MKYLPLLGSLFLSASPSVADDLLYLRCKLSVDIVGTNSITSEIVEDRTIEFIGTMKIDFKKKVIREAGDKRVVVFTVQNKMITATHKVDNDELKSNDVFKLNLTPPYKSSSKGTAVFKTVNRSATTRGEGSCEEVDASVFENALKESES